MAIANATQADFVKGGIWNATVAEQITGMGKNRVTIDLNASSVSKHVFIADRNYVVESITEIHSVVGGAAANAKLRRITDTSAPGAAASGTVVEFITAGLDLTTTVNTVVTGTLASTTLNAGEKLALFMSGTLTGLVGSVTVTLAPA